MEDKRLKTHEELTQEAQGKLENPLNEDEASVGFDDGQIGEVDVFEMNQAEKTETLKEYPANEAYDGPEPKPVDKDEEQDEKPN